MGYHINEIPKGLLGEFSKIKEEYYEFKDGMEQGDVILSLCELSDLVGATNFYLKKFDMNFDYITYGIYESTEFKRPKINSQSFIETLHEIFIDFETIVNDDKRKLSNIISKMCEFFYMIDRIINKWNLTLHDLKKFSDKTVSAFVEGKR